MQKVQGNLLPHNIEAYIELLAKNVVDKIIMQTDLDEDECKAKTRDRIKPRQHHAKIFEGQ